LAVRKRRKGEKEMMMLIQKLVRPVQNVQGATAIEYALIASLISVVAIGAMTAVGNGVMNTFNTVAGSL
jgi:pilus assembly protein Flp/PilA